MFIVNSNLILQMICFLGNQRLAFSMENNSRVMLLLAYSLIAQLCHGEWHNKTIARFTLSSSSKSEFNAEETLRKILKNYDTRLRPNYTGPSTIVRVDLSVLSFGHIEEVNMVFPADIFFRQRWNDPRLKHNFERSLALMTGKKHVTEFIWIPDTVFVNSVDSKMHDVTVSNDKVDIHPNGDVFLGTRVSIRGSCRLNLRSYPMDTQICGLGVESYAYTSNHLIYRWHVKPGITIIDQEMSQYDLQDFSTEEAFVDYAAGNYSILRAIFKFKRRTGHAILQIFTPTIAIVCVSWVSFWIDQDSIPARTTLCITTILTLSTIWSAVNSTLPRVSYIKAVDLFFLVSFCFVFMSLVEYTLVLNLSSRARERKRRKSKTETHSPEGSIIKRTVVDEDEERIARTAGQDIHCPGSKGHENLRRRFTLSKIEEKRSLQFVKHVELPETSSFDKIARIVLPFGYIIFNVYYWTKYLASDELKRFPH